MEPTPEILDTTVIGQLKDETVLKRVKYNDDTDIQEWYNFCNKKD